MPDSYLPQRVQLAVARRTRTVDLGALYLAARAKEITCHEREIDPDIPHTRRVRWSRAAGRLAEVTGAIWIVQHISDPDTLAFYIRALEEAIADAPRKAVAA